MCLKCRVSIGKLLFVVTASASCFLWQICWQTNSPQQVESLDKICDWEMLIRFQVIYDDEWLTLGMFFGFLSLYGWRVFLYNLVYGGWTECWLRLTSAFWVEEFRVGGKAGRGCISGKNSRSFGLNQKDFAELAWSVVWIRRLSLV